MRDRIAAAFAVLVALAVGAAGVWFFLLRDPGPTRQEQAEAVVSAYASAWEDGDWASMSDLAARGADLRAVHEDAWARLDVAETEVRSGPVIVDRGQADADLTVDLTLADLGEWSYDTHLTLIREEGEWRVDWSPSTLHPELEEGLTFARQITEEPERAPILDRDGAPLAERREAIVAGVHPARLDDPEDVVRAFTEHAGVPEERIRGLLERDLNPDWFYPVTPLDPQVDQQVVDLLRPFPGIVFQRQDRRSAVTEELAAHVVGEVGEITAEQLEQLGPAYQQGDIVGRSGLERVFEDQLTGEAAGRLLLVREAAVAPTPGPTGAPTGAPTDASTGAPTAPAAEIDEDDIVEVLAEFGGEDPEPVRTTLDLEVQRALEQAVQGVEGALGAVALHAPTGAIRAAVSHPLDEPFNRAFDGLYPPGSTFKIVTTAAVLAELGADVSVTCPAEVDVGGKTFRNAHDLELGEIDLATAFEVSCNTGFVQLAERLQEGDLARYAERFGFGTEPELPLPVAGGAFPEPADVTERAAAAIGQGRVQASPLHMASVAAAVASDGWRPAYLLQAETDDGETDGGEGSEPRALAPNDAEQLRGFMRRVVESGTGTAAQASGGPVHGKTGSAEFGQSAGEDDELPTHAWFIGFQGDLAFAFLVEGGGAGGDVAAPIAARFLEALS